MRLTCPNCGAQYEVGEDVIPESGRDVQCSSCGNTWFQKSAHSSEDHQASEQAEVETGADQDGTETQSTPQETVTEPAADNPPTEPGAPEPAAEPATSKSGLDEGVADILRSEAGRETAQRALDGGDTANITDPISGRSTNESSGQSKQVDVDMSDAATGARSDLLPDIEEINSTLSAEEINTAEADDDLASVAASKSGFRRGFIFAVVVFAILALVYVFAREIADAVPQLASPLSSYVDWVNQLRESVDSLMLKAVDKLTDVLSQLNGESAG